MKRRQFLKAASVTTAAAVTPVIASDSTKPIEWKMVTTWPKNFPGIGMGAEFLAKKINEMTDGQIHVTVYGAGEIVPPLEVFDAVSNGTAHMGHGTSYYWRGKSKAVQFFGAVPFGMTTDEVNSWLYYGGGMELWRDIYEPFNLVPAAAGNSGVQMFGWFNKEINRLEDLKGLKMRIPGLGGEVLSRLGATPVSMAGGEVFTSLKTGVVDAAEWVGPFNDLGVAMYKAAKYYYYPGWHEPSAVVEATINKNALDALPAHLQQIVLDACRIANQDMLADYDAQNADALDILVNEHQVQLRQLPDEVLRALKKISDEVMAEIAEENETARKVYESYIAFRDKSSRYAKISQQAFLNARNLS